jgi:hypothetical protein
VVLSAGVFLIPILSIRLAASAQGLPTHTPTVMATASPTVTVTATLEPSATPTTDRLRAALRGTSTPTGLTRSTPVPTATLAATIPAELISVTFVNMTERDVCFLYISPVESDQWGDDWLGAETVLYPSKSIVIDDIEKRSYDVKADDCENEEVWSVSGIRLADERVIEIWEK